jgi:hypothetical protein
MGHVLRGAGAAVRLEVAATPTGPWQTLAETTSRRRRRPVNCIGARDSLTQISATLTSKARFTSCDAPVLLVAATSP